MLSCITSINQRDRSSTPTAPPSAAAASAAAISTGPAAGVSGLHTAPSARSSEEKVLECLANRQLTPPPPSPQGSAGPYNSTPSHTLRRSLNVHVPLTCVIDYRGFRLTATAVLPINRSTLIYGSDDRANHVRNTDAVFAARMQYVAHGKRASNLGPMSRACDCLYEHADPAVKC